MSSITKARINNIVTATQYYYQVSIFCVQWAWLIAITLLVFGGALWFGSLAWPQYNGGFTALMGIGGWLLFWRFFIPQAWFVAKEVLVMGAKFMWNRFL